MSRYLDRDTYSQAGDWLLGTARRNPEALLLFAAGCCLLMRGGASSSSRRASYGADETRSASTGLRPTLPATPQRAARVLQTRRRITPRKSKIGFRIRQVLMPNRFPISLRMPAATYPSARRA